MGRIRTALNLAALSALLVSCCAFAQMPASTGVGSVPPAIRAAKSVFVSNAGSDSGLFPEPFSGDPTVLTWSFVQLFRPKAPSCWPTVRRKQIWFWNFD